MLSVLVVDDDFRVAQLHASYVGAAPGFEVVAVAHTADEALRQSADLQPDLVLLDSYLPDQPGLVVAARLAGTRSDVLMVTADTAATTVRTAFGAGALGYLVKPFTQEDLVARLTGYQRYRSRIERGRLHQPQIDAAFAALLPAGRTATGSRQSSVTERLVRDLVRDADDGLTATEVATSLGIGRATAQRYLSALAERAEVGITLRYGTTGRPEHEYRWRGEL